MQKLTMLFKWLRQRTSSIKKRELALSYNQGSKPPLQKNFEFERRITPTLQKSEAFSLRVSKGEAVVNYCDPLIARRLGASGFPSG